MKKFFGFLEDYVVEFDWKDLAFFKVCMIAFGTMLGVTVTRERKKPIFIVCAALFVLTLTILLARLLGFECPCCSKDEDWDEYYDDDEGFVMKISSEE